jgi:nucleotide-binding universal stress UspA family protein
LRRDAGGRRDALAAPFASAGIRAATEILSGDPAQTLLAAAEQRGADLVVLGSHGLAGGGRFVLGSVSERVLRHAHCSTLVVKEPGG